MAGDDELFLKPNGNGAYNIDTTPQPLRINKQGSPQPSDDPTQQWAAYNVPPSSSAAMYGAPTSPPPTGPLPYPDERTRRQDMPSAEGRAPSRTATPTDAEEGRAYNPRPRKASMSSEASSGAGSGDGARRRARFDANDPNRPTLGGYASSSPRLAERRGTPSKNILPESPGGPELPDKDDDGDLFQRAPRKQSGVSQQSQQAQQAQQQQDYQQQFYPPPLGSTAPTPQQQLHIPNPSGVNRLSSTASNATTRASRGSPPPPETPIDPSGGPTGLGDIEARYAASGISGTNTLNEM